jgi:hypothetical protein
VTDMGNSPTVEVSSPIIVYLHSFVTPVESILKRVTVLESGLTATSIEDLFHYFDIWAEGSR